MIISSDLIFLSPIDYPDEDFEPMPEGDKQRRNLSYTTEALKLWFESQANVYVSGNLFIRYFDQKTEKRIAPDTFVVFGMTDQDRTSYKVYEEGGKAPDFVLEVASKGTVKKDQVQNRLIYLNLRIKEYFQYDPTGEYLKPNSLQGLRFEEGEYVEIPSIILPNQVLSLSSEVLGLDLHLYPDQRFRFYDPVSQQILRSHSEAEQARFQAELERSYEQQARFQAELERSSEQKARLQAELERSLEHQARIEAEQIAQRLAERLKALGIDPDKI